MVSSVRGWLEFEMLVLSCLQHMVFVLAVGLGSFALRCWRNILSLLRSPSGSTIP
jgi:hypothetical protein